MTPFIDPVSDLGDSQSIEVEEIVLKRGAANSQTLSLGERIQGGRSLLTVSNLLSQDEINYFVESSVAAAASQSDKVQPGGEIVTLEEGYSGKVFIRMPTIAAAKRGDCDDALPEPISEKLEEVLERTFRYIDQNLCSSIKTTMFGFDDGTTSLAELFRTNQLEFSPREPAINVYWAPNGHFAMHKDGRDLTILISLSDPTKDFSGGGTAFWSQSFPQQGAHDPAVIMKPQPGTAMIFGGKVSHKGMHIQTGTRVVIVASFSRPRASSGD